MSDDEKLVKVTINMPKDKHRKLKAISALRGQGLSECITECIEAIVFAKSTSPDCQDNDDLVEVEALAKK